MKMSLYSALYPGVKALPHSEKFCLILKMSREILGRLSGEKPCFQVFFKNGQ